MIYEYDLPVGWVSSTLQSRRTLPGWGITQGYTQNPASSVADKT
jgi:hypothetical protein